MLQLRCQRLYICLTDLDMDWIYDSVITYENSFSILLHTHCHDSNSYSYYDATSEALNSTDLKYYYDNLQ
jgi:hypothetical protein